jgi:arabinofuranosyltransferase
MSQAGSATAPEARAEPRHSVWRAHAVVPVVAVVFGALYYWNAYVCDDAFITFRTVDNFVRGYGLRWNPLERVQVFTSPLFTLLTALAYWPVHDRSFVPNPDRIYGVALLLSFALSLATLLWIMARARGNPWRWPVLALLLSSQAFVTFTSSGLETPLVYLLLALFYTGFLRRDPPDSPRDCFVLFGVAGLGVLNRLDTALLYLPACLWLLARGWRRQGPAVLGRIAVALAPLGLWLGFAVVYFGFVLPNTYYPKAGLDVPPAVLHTMGLAYLSESFAQDPITLGVIAAGLCVAWIDLRSLLTACAAAGYVLYIYSLGGDFIGFRFLAPPFLVSGLLLLRFGGLRLAGAGARWAPLAVGGVVLYAALIPASPLRAAFEPPLATDVAFYHPASGLSKWRPGRAFPFDRFLSVFDAEHCASLRTVEFSVGGSGGGLHSFCRGPESHLIDQIGITDPLMARLALPIRGAFHPAHVPKPLPVGYLESVRTGENRFAAPDLAAFYAKVRTIVSGPLFSRERWRYVVELNLTPSRRFSAPYRGADGRLYRQIEVR